MSNHIGIVMGGYLDENNRLMDRQELNKRISGLKKENMELKAQLERLRSDISKLKCIDLTARLSRDNKYYYLKVFRLGDDCHTSAIALIEHLENEVEGAEEALRRIMGDKIEVNPWTLIESSSARVAREYFENKEGGK